MKKTISQRNHNVYNKKKAYVETKSSNVNKLFMIPLLIVIGIIPFIVRYHKYNTGLSIFSWYPTEDLYFDFFLYFKQLYFIITCSIMLLLLMYGIYKKKTRTLFSPIFIPLGIYAALALLSTLFSKHSGFGYTGIYEQFESVFVLLGYCLTAYYAFLFINTEADITYIMRYFLYCVLILGVLGFFQSIGHDFFSSEIGLRTILPKDMWSQAGEFEFKFGKNCTYLSMYNPNYVGVYTALTIPVFACFALTLKDRKVKILSLVATILLLICLYGSKSNAGVIGILAAAVFIIIFMRKYIFRKPKIMIPVIVMGIAAVLILVAVKWNAISGRFLSMLKPVKAETALTDIHTTQDYIVVKYNGNELRVAIKESEDGNVNIDIKDGDNQELTIINNPETSMFDIQDERFQNVHIKPTYYEEILITDIQIDGKEWRFVYDAHDKNYYYLNRFGRMDQIKTAESAVFTGYESFASNRGYLWSRTIPLLKDHILLGSGADTFVMEFPHNDYVNLYKYGFENETVTKPHSFYLQMGVQTGVLSLLAFLVFYAMYFISSVYLYIKGQFENVFSQTGVAIFIGTVTFMITGISNDSCIAVTPVFWGLLGIGIAVNRKVSIIRKQDKT